VTPNNQDNRICWKADTGTDTDWIALTSSGGTPSTRDSGLALDTNFHEFYIGVDSSAISLAIDGVPYAALTTNIPTTEMAPYMRITTVSNTVRSLSGDFCELWGGRDT
jgi:hypothetical protein